MPKRVSDEEFIATFKRIGTYTGTARALDLDVSNIKQRCRFLSTKYGITLVTNDSHSPYAKIAKIHPDTGSGRLCKNIETGTILIGSDAHYFPDNVTRAHKAFVKLCRELKPNTIVMNGDVFDGATISRWPRIGWDKKPTVKQELDTCKERLQEITDAAPRATYIWPLGNHDARFETFLAANAAEYEGIKGFHLKDNFPEWKPCWSFFVNQNTVIKHRFKGGINSTHNATLWSGRTMVNGHLHSLKVTPFSDYNGTRYGVDTGTLADVYGEQFTDYTEDNPKNWRSGFAVLTYHKGELLPPETCEIRPFGPVFRGQILSV